ncbi:hypothetical protein ABQE36_14495 [Enterococcus avium]|uniref:hypothetical protein n=1 Tax=Enterococcus avium TaxID=33945 RepID=UPI0032E43531
MNRGKKFIFLFAVFVFVVIGIIGHDYYKQEKDLSVISSIQEEKIAFFTVTIAQIVRKFFRKFICMIFFIEIFSLSISIRKGIVNILFCIRFILFPLFSIKTECMRVRIKRQSTIF